LVNFFEKDNYPKKIKNERKLCFHCSKKIKKNFYCSLCLEGHCKLCTFTLSKFRDSQLLKESKFKIRLCFGCRDFILKEKNIFNIFKINHCNSNYDFKKKVIEPPIWDNAYKNNCKNCDINFNGKKYMCGLCADNYCKKCCVKCQDPSDVFCNPFDIYSFYICFECRYYKTAGFILNKIFDKKKRCSCC